MSTTVRYVGPFAAVECRLDDKPVVLKHGETIDVSAAQAKNLVLQEENWEKVDEKKSGDSPPDKAASGHAN